MITVLLVVAFIFIPFFLSVLLNLLPIISNHYRSKEEINSFKALSRVNSNVFFENIRAKLRITTGNKEYLNLVNSCDIHLSENYIVFILFQTFPWKLYHYPVLFAEKIEILNNIGVSHRYKPEKIVFKEVVKDEVEIIYKVMHQRRILRIKGLNQSQKQQLEKIKNWYL